MQGAHILAHYTAIAQLTRSMLEAARDSDWDRLVELERSCGAYFALLLETGARRPEPWLAQLSLLIGNTQQQSRLQHAYRAGE